MAEIAKHTLNIKLNGFIDSRVVELANDATNKLEKGIFIPFEQNCIEQNKVGNYYAKCYVNDANFDRGYSRQSYSVVLRLSAEKAKEMKELGYKYFPMGYMTDNYNYKSNNNYKSGQKVKLSDYE